MIDYSTDFVRLSAEQVAGLYESVGFGCAETYIARPDFLEKLFGPGVYGFFAHEANTLIGLARVFSDDNVCSWVAEICVHPKWQRRGIGRQLYNMLNQRFSHTALYLEALVGETAFFAEVGIRPKSKLVACSRAPLPQKK